MERQKTPSVKKNRLSKWLPSRRF